MSYEVFPGLVQNIGQATPNIVATGIPSRYELSFAPMHDAAAGSPTFILAQLDPWPFIVFFFIAIIWLAPAAFWYLNRRCPKCGAFWAYFYTGEKRRSKGLVFWRTELKWACKKCGYTGWKRPPPRE